LFHKEELVLQAFHLCFTFVETVRKEIKQFLIQPDLSMSNFEVCMHGPHPAHIPKKFLFFVPGHVFLSVRHIYASKLSYMAKY